MERMFKRWRVTGYQRPAFDVDEAELRVKSLGYLEPVVVVLDPRGFTWEVTVKDGKLASLTVRTKPGVEITPRALSVTPTTYLTDVATTYTAAVERAYEEGMQLADAFAEADRQAGQVRMSDEPPTLEEFAQAWKETPVTQVIDGGRRRLPRRTALAERYGISPYGIDKWIAQARAEGLIPPVGGARRGRRAGDEYERPSVSKRLKTAADEQQARIDEWVQRTVAEAPPLTDEQAAHLAALLNPTGATLETSDADRRRGTKKENKK